MSGFLGQYEFQLDEKGRLSLPAAFRRGAEEEASAFVLLQWEDPYLSLFPMETWAEVQARLLDYRREGPQAIAHVRRITAAAVEVIPDRQGRILIPARLQQAAALEGTVLVLGNLNRIELWNPDRFRQFDERAAEGFESFAHQIFGL